MERQLSLHLCITVLIFAVVYAAKGDNKCIQGVNCKLPNCFCPTYAHPLGNGNIPQIVYFGFDDAVQPQVSAFYNSLFTKKRKNPNGCPITKSLYVSHANTIYQLVSKYYKAGDEIGAHSVTHANIDTADKLRKEASEQKAYIATQAQVPTNKIIGWRSPNLKTAGDDQPKVLKQLGYEYDISLSYSRDRKYPFPFTLDYGYPYPCSIPSCPKSNSSYAGFWEVMIHIYQNPKTGYPCSYVDGCRPANKADALKYLWDNFFDTYTHHRAPFGLNMHAAWFFTPHNLAAMNTFIDGLLKYSDVYIVSVAQMLEWMKSPTPLSQIKSFKPWSCKK